MTEKDADFFFQKGFKAHSIEMYGPSKRYLEKSLEIDPNHENSLYLLAILYFNLIPLEESKQKINENRDNSTKYFKKFLTISQDPKKRKTAEEILRILDENYL